MNINVNNFKKLISLASTVAIISMPIIGNAKTHVVSNTDTLIKISEKYYGTGDYWKQLMKYNNISNPKLLITGSTINIPSLETLIGGSIEKESEKTSKPIVITTNDYQKNGITYHLVSEKDTLINICRYYYNNGDYWKALMQYNHIKDARLLITGSYIAIPSVTELLNKGFINEELPIVPLIIKPAIDETYDYAKDGIMYHLVGKKDTFNGLSNYYYNTSEYANALMKYNGIKNARLLITGSYVKIPPLEILKDLGLVENKTVMPYESNTENSKAKKHDKVIDDIIYHKFTNDDTLWDLCVHYYGTGIYWEQVAEYNGIENQRKIPTGLVIMFPTIQYVNEKSLIKTK